MSVARSPDKHYCICSLVVHSVLLVVQLGATLAELVMSQVRGRGQPSESEGETPANPKTPQVKPPEVRRNPLIDRWLHKKLAHELFLMPFSHPSHPSSSLPHCTAHCLLSPVSPVSPLCRIAQHIAAMLRGDTDPLLEPLKEKKEGKEGKDAEGKGAGSKAILLAPSRSGPSVLVFLFSKSTKKRTRLQAALLWLIHNFD